MSYSVHRKYINCSPDRQEETPLRKRRKKPSVSSSWTHSDINNLIMSVEEHPCIWEYSSADYKDRSKREQAWLEIQENSGHTVEDCKAKWANVKTAFQNVKKKMKARSDQGEEIVQPHWIHWPAMKFFHNHDTTKNTSIVHTSIEEVQIDSVSETPFETENLQKKDILQRAVRYLEAEEDNWHEIGMYLASQMRQIAKKSKKRANRLHRQFLKAVIDATSEAENED